MFVSQRAVLLLGVGSKKQELAVLVDREANRTAELILRADVGGLADRVIGGEAAAAIVLVSFAVHFVGA